MSYDPKNPHYDPYTAPPVYDNQPVTGYPDQPGYPDSAPPQQGGYYPGAYGYQQPMAPAYGPTGFPPPMQYRVPENGVGTAAMVCGILGLVFCTIAAIAAIICGHIGVKKADRGEADNRGQAQAGLIMGYIGAGLWLMIIVVYVLFVVMAIGAASTSTTY